MEQQEQSKSNASSSNSAKKETWEWIKALFIAALLVIVLRWLVASPFVVEGPSMQPNFETGEKLIVNKWMFDVREPKRGEVIVFQAPDGRDYIKRVIALPGEKVRVEGDKVFVNGEPIQEPYLQEVLDEAAKKGILYNRARSFSNFAEATVPVGHLFAMGDNRYNSSDSRDPGVGFVPYEKIIGRADVIYWPLGKISLIH